jgi:hypothetical protein
MTSRATPDGSPGSARLLTPITCAASSWATLGLARLVPKEKSAPNADTKGNAQKPPRKIALIRKGGDFDEQADLPLP